MRITCHHNFLFLQIVTYEGFYKDCHQDVTALNWPQRYRIRSNPKLENREVIYLN